ncbi:MAG: helix-turn-helix domain-containing protein [Sphingomonas adhaesiva]|uniref:Ada metal-binding domain-containing protein n=1 Tax=Sphingomonas adhaesiva TaxID=28212 RepID=UPI002FF5B8B9
MRDAIQMIDPEQAWQAFARRDRAYDGRFVVAVRTTGIYCKPSCAARRPSRSHVEILPDNAAARAAGYRACRRCLPDAAARDRTAVTAAAEAIMSADAAIPLATLAAHAGYAPHHFHRLFVRATGTTPAAFARQVREMRAADALADGGTVTAAIYAAGYAAPSRFYAAAERVALPPAARARGGEGATIRLMIVPTSLGPLMIAARGTGLVHAAFDEDADALACRFPAATILSGAVPGDAVAAAEAVPRDTALPRAILRIAFLAALGRGWLDKL